MNRQETDPLKNKVLFYIVTFHISTILTLWIVGLVIHGIYIIFLSEK